MHWEFDDYEFDNLQNRIDRLNNRIYNLQQELYYNNLNNLNILSPAEKRKKVINKINAENMFLNKEEPFIVIYKSKPIQGIVLELIGKNPKYNWE